MTRFFDVSLLDTYDRLAGAEEDYEIKLRDFLTR